MANLVALVCAVRRFYRKVILLSLASDRTVIMDLEILHLHNGSPLFKGTSILQCLSRERWITITLSRFTDVVPVPDVIALVCVRRQEAAVIGTGLTDRCRRKHELKDEGSEYDGAQAPEHAQRTIASEHHTPPEDKERDCRARARRNRPV
jgi:hypothetical protein